VLAFTLGIALATALFFGVVPAVHASGVAPMTALNAHGRATSANPLGWTSGLLVAQVALSVVLVVAAGLFVRTFASLATRHVGFDRDRVLMVHVDAQRTTVDPAQRTALYERIREATRTVPGVAEAAVSMAMPVFSGPMMVIRIDQVSGGMALPEGDRRTTTNVISPGWFSTFGIPVLAGRDFTDRDRTSTPLVVVVNQAFARKFLNGASPLGHTITANRGPLEPVYQIVGVASDAVYGSLRSAMPPVMYVPIAQLGKEWSPRLASVNLSVRSSGASPALLTKSVAAVIVDVNPQLALTFRPLADAVDASVMQERLVAMLSGLFGGLALLLAGLGLYGVTAYAVSRRRTEIGIRMALGAAPGSVIKLVLSRVTVQVALGVAIGGAMSLWASKFVATLLYGLEPRDLTTLIGAAVVLGCVAAMAAWLPARRAARIDPAEVLREG
jgi:predicted permease